MAETLRRALCSLDDVKNYLGIEVGETRHDDLLVRLINAASQLVHRWTGREFVPANPAAQMRVFDVDPSTAEDRILVVGDLASWTTLTVKNRVGDVVETHTPGSNIVELARLRDPEWEPIEALWFLPGLADSVPIRRGYTVVITGVWGFPGIPPLVREYAVIQACLPFARDVAKWSLTFRLETGRVEMPRVLSPTVEKGLRFFKRISIP